MKTPIDPNDKWYDSDDPSKVVRGASWRIGLWILAATIFFALIGAAWWGVSVLTSDVKGQGDAIKTKNSSVNRINKQERFEDLFADIKAADQRIDVMAVQLKKQPDSQVWQTNYTGAITYCITVANQYDAEARKYTAEAFRAADLPPKIDQQDPATDCKEATS